MSTPERSDRLRSPEDVRGADVGEANVTGHKFSGLTLWSEEGEPVLYLCLRDDTVELRTPNGGWYRAEQRAGEIVPMGDALRSPEPTAEPMEDIACPECGCVSFDSRGACDECGKVTGTPLRAPAEPHYTLDEVADMLVGEADKLHHERTVVGVADPRRLGPLNQKEVAYREAARWLRSGGATTETGETK